nr:MAG TPA: hypothetical protein [Caudoviricetes sp.]
MGNQQAAIFSRNIAPQRLSKTESDKCIRGEVSRVHSYRMEVQSIL